MLRTKDPLRVLIATPLGLGGRGGIDRLTDLIIEQAKAQENLGIQVGRLITRGGGRIFWTPFIFAHALTRFYCAARRREVGLLHIQLASRGSAYRKIVLGAISRRLHIPYVVHLHGGLFDQFWASAGASVNRSINQLFTESAEIIVLSRRWQQLLSNRLPSVKDKITVIYNATKSNHRDRALSKDGRIRISFFGKLGEKKGTPQLIEALGRLADRTDWIATIAGDGKINESRAHAQRLGLVDRVDFPGWLGSDAAADLFRRTDIVALPSFIENLPMAIIEAFASGAVVVATPVGSITEIIDHERNGLIVPVGDVKALADAIRRLIENPKLRRSLAEAARRDYCERYEITVYFTRLAMIWRRAAQSSRA